MQRNQSSSSGHGQRGNYNRGNNSGGSGNYGYGRGNDNYGRGNIGNNDNYGMGNSSRIAPLMDLKTGMARERFDDDYSLGPRNADYKTPEQIAFDTEFKKWEESFEEWKLNNKNHPDLTQYRYYEKKFLDVREKLLEKRKEIYGNIKSRGAPSTEFDNQLCAADAMAKSILSKFGESTSRMDDSLGMSYYGRGIGMDMNRGGGGGGGGQRDSYRNNQGGGGYDDMDMMRGGGVGRYDINRYNHGGGGGGYSGPMGNSIVDELSRLSSNPQNRWILSALSSALGSQMNQRPQPLFPGRQPQPLFPRGIPRMNSRRNEPRRSGAPANDKKVKKNKKKRQRDREEREQAGGKVAKKSENQHEEITESLFDKLDEMIETAKLTECPKLLSGSANKRLRKVKSKKPEEWDENEKKLVSYYEFISQKRSKYFAAKDKLNTEKMDTDGKTEQPAVEVADAPEVANATEVTDEKMEDEPIQA